MTFYVLLILISVSIIYKTHRFILHTSIKINHNKNNKIQPNIVIGLSTGRSGTLAVANLLNRQKNTRVFHELNQCSLEWPNKNKNFSSDHLLSKAKQHLFDLQIKIQNSESKTLDEYSDYHLIGDIASWNLPYVESYLKLESKIKFLAFIRKEEDCIYSWEKWLGREFQFLWMSRELNSEIDENYPNFPVHFSCSKIYQDCFPHFDDDIRNLTGLEILPDDDPEQKMETIARNQVISPIQTYKLNIRYGAEKYYKIYNQKLRKLAMKYPRKIKIYDSYQLLNNFTVQIEVFEWLEIEGPYVFDFQEKENENLESFRAHHNTNRQHFRIPSDMEKILN